MDHIKRQALLARIEADREAILNFVRDLVRAKSPNPPGDTRSSMQCVRDFLDARNVPYRLENRDETMPNLVATTTFGGQDRHLVLNGHIDVFPVPDSAQWSIDPWAAQERDGAIYGRGVADMKVGTMASIITYAYAHAMVEGQLDGRLTLAVVSDEETFGPNGTRHLFEVCPEEITGTAVLVGEPSSRHTVRLGEKGMLWLRFKVETQGGHGAYVHIGPSAVDQSSTVIADLRKFADFDFQEPPSIVMALTNAGAAYDRAFGSGASRNARRVTMNVGRINAGTNVNMIASQCTFEVDFRLPMGVVIQDALDYIEKLRETHGFTYDIMMASEPNWTEPDHEFVKIVATNAAMIAGAPPQLIPGLGSTDARLWRNRGVPAVVYGPAPRGMGAIDEHVPVEEIIDVVRCHVLSAFDYLSAKER
ncbi:succinyl-diaminopimelate desuccinylase [Bradyrhizobium sp. LB14.3]|uniref:M20/M25/M40 family metallo-hydrolase n=1 Tax=Bradyrhizobium sp. LB14.3 TaxID=3156328 RepID=UPI003398FD0A